MTTALITGASSGLGAEFARQLAAQGHNLVLVARGQDRLEALAQELRAARGIEAEVLAADLTDTIGLGVVVTRLSDPSRPIGILVNNAGHGLLHDFDRTPLEEEVQHLRLHVEAALSATRAVLPGMLARGEGRIINVASVAAYLPRGTYSAAKAWLLAFSRWANAHYRRSGVKVTALCPGLTRTEFHARMGMETRGLPGWAWLSAPRVVSEGLRDNEAGKAVSIPSTRYKAVVAASKVLPARIMAGPAKRPRR
ncbi:dehydrogenase [Sinomonas cellulolyticus]|uniref:SDR family oxidoreductase n=1 Tax=Sinomonas cellulolyticus TaxID=2801916 RepID=A0ABS1K517_9MICC|nr:MULTISPECIES: SDR family oxidoreductase [Sinomonas]MBL0706614.1 SDR family oxidoreductase [Sinomonas cellulolyticus]GHG60322.1 dehydrogenase [Sinomonas sp. KCTC 49339]